MAAETPGFGSSSHCQNCTISQALPARAGLRGCREIVKSLLRTHLLHDVMVGTGPDHPSLAVLNS